MLRMACKLGISGRERTAQRAVGWPDEAVPLAARECAVGKKGLEPGRVSDRVEKSRAALRYAVRMRCALVGNHGLAWR